MPTTTTVTSNYVGKAAGELIGASYKEMDTIQKNGVTFLQNINTDTFLRKIGYTDGRQAYSCGFTPSGAVTLTERTLSPVKVKNDLQVCKEDFRTQWSGDTIGPSASNPSLPADVQAAMLTEMLAENAEENDRVIWNGDSSNTDEWDGFITLFEADASIIKDGNGLTAPGTATVGKTTVLAGFELVTTAAPKAVRTKSDFVLVASSDVVLSLYQLLISNAASNGLGLNTNNQIQYGKWPVIEIAGLPDGVLLGYRRSNLVFGTGLLGDHNNIAMVDEDEIGLLTGQVRAKMVFNGGCQYYNSNEIVYLDYSA
jgi:RNA polymerase subunit RPABC4/transcription elongation factor Spt4